MPSLSGVLHKLHLDGGKHRKSASTSSNHSDHHAEATPASPSSVSRTHRTGEDDVVVIDRETGHHNGMRNQHGISGESTGTSHSAVDKDLPVIPAGNTAAVSAVPSLPPIPTMEPLSEVGAVGDSAPSVHAASPLKKDHRIVDGLDGIADGTTGRHSRATEDVAIPARGTSQLQADLVNQPVGTRVNLPATLDEEQLALVHRLRSTRDPDVDSSEHLKRHLAHLNLFPGPVTTRPNTLIRSMPLVAAPPLEIQRAIQVKEIVTAAKARKEIREPLTLFGRGVFKSGGIEHLLDVPDTVEVHTTWLEPVVQEHVRRIEHTEYLTVILRDVHKYHIYPKIQPIYDPNPILLKPRHRIFSTVDNKWHEVIGDEAAIEILGEDVFRNGKKTYREERGMALPGLGGTVTDFTGDDIDQSGRGLGLGRVIEREGILGKEMGPWKELSRLNIGSLGEGNTELGLDEYEHENRRGHKTVGIAF